MTDTDEINKLKVEVAQDLLKSYLSKVITTQERILFLKKHVEEVSKKKEKERSEEEKKLIKEHQGNLAAFTEGIEQSEIHIQNFLSLIESYSKNEPVKL